MRSTAAQAWRADPKGVRLLVRASPGSGIEAVERVVETAQGPALAVRVRAVAHKGQANRAVEMAVATWLGLPKSRVAVAAGGKSRLKTLVVGGDPTTLMPLLKKRVCGLL
jgi:uncharacterized protein YggU (UPF0235/DUF167 family)